MINIKIFYSKLLSIVSSFKQAFEEYSKKNFQKSYSLFDKSLETLKQDSVMLQEKGMIFINLEKYEEALVYLDKILITNPTDIEILIRKGKSCEALGKTEQAIECFNHILSIQPSNVDALRSKAIIFINQEKYEDAMTNLDQILLTNPTDFDVMYFKGIVLEQQGQHAQAVNYYLKSLKITSNDTSVLQSISLHMVHLLGKEHAVPIFKSLIENDPNDILAQDGMKIFSSPIYDY